MNNSPVVKFAISPTGTPVGLPDKIQYNKFLINSTPIPAIGPIVMTAISAGISPKSIFKNGGMNGNGKFNFINTVAIPLNIAIMINRRKRIFCIMILLLRFTSQKGKVLFFYKKTLKRVVLRDLGIIK